MSIVECPRAGREAGHPETHQVCLPRTIHDDHNKSTKNYTIEKKKKKQIKELVCNHCTAARTLN